MVHFAVYAALIRVGLIAPKRRADAAASSMAMKIGVIAGILLVGIALRLRQKALPRRRPDDSKRQAAIRPL